MTPSSASSTDKNSAPVFQTPGCLDDELELQFAAAPAAQSQGDELDSTLRQFTTAMDTSDETPAYRDAAHVFASAPVDLVALSDMEDARLFASTQTKAPEFVLEQTPRKSALETAIKAAATTASPQSPASASSTLAVPEKDCWGAVFSAANPSFPSRCSPDAIMAAVRNALAPFDCVVNTENRWTLRVSWLCVAEEIVFRVLLSQERVSGKYQVDFCRELGDEAVFLELVECVRARCSEVDLEPLFFMETVLDPWLDASKELKGRRHAIRDTDAALLIKELNADLHAETLYEVAKTVKNHCRHQGNRRLFLRADRAGFLSALKWMLGDCDVLARFAAFILLQLSKDSRDGSDESGELFSSAFERNSFALLLSELKAREEASACAKFTTRMVEQVQQSWIFA